MLLPTTVEDTHHQSGAPQNSPGLVVHVWNLETLRKQNTDNVRCVCWVLRNITDQEAIDSAIRLAGTIRWFDSDSDLDPPFDFIVSTFEACFDSTKHPHPGMRDRAYFSARAILQINLMARAHGRTPEYQIPDTSSNASHHTDPDLHHIIHLLKRNTRYDKPTLVFPRAGANTHDHLVWMSNFFVELTHVQPIPVLGSYASYLSVAITDHQPTIANVLLMWYMFLGGRVEEETFWAADKSYVLRLIYPPFSPLNNVLASDSLEIILSHLSIRMMNAIVDGRQNLNFLLEFLAAWEKRPVCLTSMAYEWCSAISEVAGTLGLRPLYAHPFNLEVLFSVTSRSQPGLQLRLRPQDLASHGITSQAAESRFACVGSNCDPVHTDGVTSPGQNVPNYYGILLSMILEIGFRLIVPRDDPPALLLDRALHHDFAFEADDDDVIADGVCAWAIGCYRLPVGSSVLYLVNRARRKKPLSPRLRRMCIYAIEYIWHDALWEPQLETIHLLNYLEIDVDDVGDKHRWVLLLVEVIRSPGGLEALSFHHWCLLDRLISVTNHVLPLALHDVELRRSLEGAEYWEKMEVWMVIVWRYIVEGEVIEGQHPFVEPTEPGQYEKDPELVRYAEYLERVTLKLLRQRPSALPRFEDLSNLRVPSGDRDVILQRVCTRARAEQIGQFPSEPLPLYVSDVLSVACLS